jgi:hypothetical protein
MRTGKHEKGREDWFGWPGPLVVRVRAANRRLSVIGNARSLGRLLIASCALRAPGQHTLAWRCRATEGRHRRGSSSGQKAQASPFFRKTDVFCEVLPQLSDAKRTVARRETATHDPAWSAKPLINSSARQKVSVMVPQNNRAPRNSHALGRQQRHASLKR